MAKRHGFNPGKAKSFFFKKSSLKYPGHCGIWRLYNGELYKLLTVSNVDVADAPRVQIQIFKKGIG